MFGSSQKNTSAVRLKNLPALLAAHEAAGVKRIARRADLIKGIEHAKASFESADAALIAKATPIEAELKILRARIKELEEQLAPLANARMSEMFSSNDVVRRSQHQLRADALEELVEFDRRIEATRDHCQDAYRNTAESLAHDSVLRNFRPSLSKSARVDEAMKLTLEASREAHRLALTEADIASALDRVCADLLASGLELKEP